MNKKKMSVGSACDHKMCVLSALVIHGEYTKLDKFSYTFKIHLESKFHWELYAETYTYSVYV